MDYLVRDAYYTGTAYGVVDLERLIRNLHWRKGKLVLLEKGITAGQSLLLARAMMYPTVYFHHTARIAGSMLAKAVELEAVPFEEVRWMDEVDLVARLRSSEKAEVRELIHAIDSRRLYKRVVWSGKPVDEKHLEELKKELEAEFGHLALLDYFHRPRFEEKNAFVLVGEELVRLSEVSPLVRALIEAEDAQWRWGIYARRDVLKRVERFVARIYP